MPSLLVPLIFLFCLILLSSTCHTQPLQPPSATIVVSNLLDEGYHSDCLNHYQSAAYAMSPQLPRICIYGEMLKNGTCLNWVDCYQQFAARIALYNPKFIGYRYIGDYPPTTSDNYVSIVSTFNDDFIAKLLTCRPFGETGYCYVHGQCETISHCLQQLSTIIGNISFSDSNAGYVVGLYRV